MAFTSFTLRNTLSNNGSSLRRTNVNQDSSNPNGSGTAVFDSALRADGFFLPFPSEYLESTFSVNVYRRDEVDLQWAIATPLVDTPTSPTDFEPVELLIRASGTGEPVTANDGVLVRSYVYNNYEESLIDRDQYYIVDGGWVYYSLFLKYASSSGDAFYEKVADLSVQIPINFGSTENLWSRIPTYYRELDEDYAKNTTDYEYEKGPLYRFIDLFGWEMDKIRTTTYDTMRINDPDVVHSSAIDALANQAGIEFGKNSLGTSKLRTILNNIGFLRRSKGTQDSVEAYISALSGCGVTVENNIKETITTDSTNLKRVVKYANGKWVMVGLEGEVRTSTDGINWTVSTVGVTTTDLTSIDYGNGIWIAGGAQNGGTTPVLFKSVDGVAWTPISTPDDAFGEKPTIIDITYDNNTWMVLYNKRTSTTVIRSFVYISTDGNSWTESHTNISYPYSLGGISYGGGKWVIANGTYTSTSTNNGINWTTTSVAPRQLSDIDYKDGVWIAASYMGNLISFDNAVTWLNFSGSGYPTQPYQNGRNITHNGDTWYLSHVDFASPDGGVYTSKDGINWTFFKNIMEDPFSIGFSELNTLIVSRFNVHLFSPIIDFNVHPMRVNLFPDPLFSQAATTSETLGVLTRKYAELYETGRSTGWGVYTVKPSGVVGNTSIDVSDNTVAITLAPGLGTSTIYIYSRRAFTYNNNLIYYASAESTHDFSLRFFSVSDDNGLPALDWFTPTPIPDYITAVPMAFDSWNDSLGINNFPKFYHPSRKIVGSIPFNGTLDPEIISTLDQIVAFKFEVNHSSSADTIVVFKDPLVEYKNSSGDFFTGSTPMGGFIPNANIEGDPGAGFYDYHWGAGAVSTAGKDFSFYTLDFQRSRSVTEDVVSKYIMPVTMVKNTDYRINWEVLE